MQGNASAGRGRLGVFVVACATIFGMTFLVRADDAAGKGNIAKLIDLGHKFLGSSSCKSCHGDPAADPGQPPKKGSEFTVWSTLDKHHASFATLQTDRSKD